MKKVLVLFGRSDWRKSHPFNNEQYRDSYELFYTLCKKENIQLYRASYEWYDYRKHIFKHAWIYESESTQWRRVDNIAPDLIYDKTKGRPEVFYKKETIGTYYPFVNDLRFTRIINDKFLSSLLFQEWSKKNFIVRSQGELEENVSKISTKKVVLKPISESGGNGVQIFEKESVSNIKFSGEHIIQDFIDSSDGVPGISSAAHDFRLVIVNDDIIYAYIREPKEGSLLANISQGGILKIIPNENIPESVQPIIKYSRSIFTSFYPKIYTIDIMFDENKRPWIVELNSMPGLYFTTEEKPCMERLYRALLEVFQDKLSRES